MVQQTSARQLVVGALILTAIMTGSLIYLSSFINPDTEDRFQDYNKTFQKLDSMQENADNMQEQIQGSDTTGGAFGFIDGLTKTVWGTIQLIWDSVTGMGTIIGDVGSTTPIPAWFTGILISIIGVVVAFAIMAAVFKWYI